MQHMQDTVNIIPAASPEMKPTRTPGVGNWLQWADAISACFDATFVGALAELVGVGSAEVEEGEEAERVLDAEDVEDADVGLGVEVVEEIKVDVLEAGNEHILLLTHVMPPGQHWSPHACSGVDKSVVKSWLSGCAVAFCS